MMQKGFVLTCPSCSWRMRMQATRKQAAAMNIFCSACREPVHLPPSWQLEYESKGRQYSFALHACRIYVGRKKADSIEKGAVFIALEDPDRLWSRVHFLLSRHGNGWIVSNLSGKGTGIDSDGEALYLLGEEMHEIQSTACLHTMSGYSINILKSW